MNLFVVAIEGMQSNNPSVPYDKLISYTELGYAQAGQAIDEAIFLYNRNINLVYVNADNQLNYSDIALIEKTMPYYCDTIYFASDKPESSFFCRPAIFSSISRLYKVDFSKYSEKSNLTLYEKMMHMSNRLNFSAMVCSKG